MVVLAGAGCKTAQPRMQPQMQASSPKAAEPATGCPLGVSSATVVALDTAEGIALNFRAPDNELEMRERANDAAAQHGPGKHLGRGHDNGEHGDGGAHGLQMMQMPAARSIAEDIDGGSQIRFVAIDPADSGILRAKMRRQAEVMMSTPCPRRAARF